MHLAFMISPSYKYATLIHIFLYKQLDFFGQAFGYLS